MNPILFSDENSVQNNNMVGILSDCISCYVTEERNSIFECQFEYPVDGKFFERISIEKYIKVACNNADNMQTFIIYRQVGTERGTVIFYCEHISYLLNSRAVLPFTFSQTISCQDVITRIRQNMRPNEIKWNIRTNISSHNNHFELKVPTSVREILLSSGHILSRWKGEYEFDNYNVILHNKRGKELSICLNYGVNIKNAEADISISETYTHMLPYMIVRRPNSDDDMLYTLSAGSTFDPDTDAIIPYPNSEQYKNKRINIVDFSSKYDSNTNNDNPVEALRSMAVTEASYNVNQYNNISNSITIGYVDFLKNINTGDEDARRIKICDWISLCYIPLGIYSQVQIVRTVYDVLSERYTELGIGTPKRLIGDIK